MERLRVWGYNEKSISGSFIRAANQDRDRLIFGNCKKKKLERSVFSFQYNPMACNIRQTGRKSWHILESDCNLKKKKICPSYNLEGVATLGMSW